MCVNMPDIESLLFKDLNELNELILDIDAYMTLDVGHAHNNGFPIDEMLKYPRINTFTFQITMDLMTATMHWEIIKMITVWTSIPC